MSPSRRPNVPERLMSFKSLTRLFMVVPLSVTHSYCVLLYSSSLCEGQVLLAEWVEFCTSLLYCGWAGNKPVISKNIEIIYEAFHIRIKTIVVRISKLWYVTDGITKNCQAK